MNDKTKGKSVEGNGKIRKLTPQQRMLVKHLLKGMSITDAAIKAGYSEKYAGQCGSQALEAIRQKMPQILDNAGLTDKALVEKYLKPALEANETTFAKFQGKITDSKDCISWGPRLNALDVAFNLKGSYAPKASQGNTNIYAQNAVIVCDEGRRAELIEQRQRLLAGEKPAKATEVQ